MEYNSVDGIPAARDRPMFDELILLDSYTKSLENVLKIEKELQILRHESSVKINNLNDRATFKQNSDERAYLMQLKLSSEEARNGDDIRIFTSVHEPHGDSVNAHYRRFFAQAKVRFDGLANSVMIGKIDDGLLDPRGKADEKFYNRNLCSNAALFSREKLTYDTPNRHNFTYPSKYISSDLCYIGKKVNFIETNNTKHDLKDFESLKIESKHTVDYDACDPNTLVEQLNGVCHNLINQHSRDEELLSKYINIILNIKEKAVINSAKHELLRLKIKGGNAFEQLSSLKKKQRGLLIKLQQEYNEIKLMKNYQKKLFDERRKALLRQLRYFKTVLGVNGYEKNFRNNINLKSSLSYPNKNGKKLPLKCYDITLNDTSEDYIRDKRNLQGNHKKTLNDLLLLHFELQLNATALNLIDRKNSNSEIVTVLKELSQKSILELRRDNADKICIDKKPIEIIDSSIVIPIETEILKEEERIPKLDKPPNEIVQLDNATMNLPLCKNININTLPILDSQSADSLLVYSDSLTLFGKTFRLISSGFNAKSMKRHVECSPSVNLNRFGRKVYKSLVNLSPSSNSLCKSLFFHSAVDPCESVFSVSLLNKFHLVLEFTCDTKNYLVCCKVSNLLDFRNRDDVVVQKNHLKICYNERSLMTVDNFPSSVMRFIQNVNRTCFGNRLKDLKLNYNNLSGLSSTGSFDLGGVHFKCVMSEDIKSEFSNVIFLTDNSDFGDSRAVALTSKNIIPSFDAGMSILEKIIVNSNSSVQLECNQKIQKANEDSAEKLLRVSQINKSDVFVEMEFDQNLHENVLTCPIPAIVTKSTNQLEEAEELRKKQLAIEMEIKALLEQQTSQLPYFLVREIPDKPPPPYIPPEDKAECDAESKTVVRNEQVVNFVKMCYENIWEAYVSRSYSSRCDTLEILKEECESFKENNLVNVSKQFLFDLCNELFIHKYKNVNKRLYPWEYRKRLQQSRSDVCTSVETATMQCLGFGHRPFKDNIFINCAHKLQDHVDELLIRELQDEEAEWVNIDEYEMGIKNSVTESILKDLIANTIREYVEISQKKD